MSFADYMVNAAIERGCGKRQDGGLYACSGTSRNGRPVEDFIVDAPPLADFAALADQIDSIAQRFSGELRKTLISAAAILRGGIG